MSFNKKKLAIAAELSLIIIALCIAACSFCILLALTPIPPTREVALWLILSNFFCILYLSLTIGSKLLTILRAYKKRRSAFSLHIQIISLFSIIATLPALAVAIVATITLHFGLDRWFDKNTTEIVNSSIDMANGYAEETLKRIYNIAYTMRLTLDNKNFYTKKRDKYQHFLTLQAAAHKLEAAFLLDCKGNVLLKANFKHQSNPPIPPATLIKKSTIKEPFLFQPGQYDYFGVIIKFKNIPDTYLYVLGNVNKKVLSALRLTEENTNRYKDLQDARVPTQIAFGLLYLSLFLVMWLCAIWTGIKVADKILRPIKRLIDGADEVAKGNLQITLPIYKSDGDISQLLKTFNYMVYELQNQHSALINARDQVDERRRFTEAVLSGVRAGVVGVDSCGKITIVNPSLESMFQVDFKDLYKKTLFSLHAEIAEIFEKCRYSQRTQVYKQVTIDSAEGERVYTVQMTREDSCYKEHSWVITIDDITDLVAAQRSSAWADIARRIAHEIKNPLTPIQLSAERIKRRYQNRLLEDRDVLDQCTDTIIRQVEDIGRMVDEFSSFARMPKAKLSRIDIRDSLKEACFLVRVTQQDMIFEQDFAKEPLWSYADSRLLIQAFANLLKNATEAFNNYDFEQKPHILIRAYKIEKKDKQYIVVEIIDNGKGLPENERHKLLEPYITTREKGTGLGLAIVKKIVEDHEGYMELLDAPDNFYKGRGAMIRVQFPASLEEI